MRFVAHLATATYCFIMPAVYLPGSGASWSEAGLFILSCIIIYSAAYTVFASVYYLDSGRKSGPIIKGTIVCVAGLGLINWSGVFISDITPIQYGILGIFMGLILAMNRKPDQEDIDAINQ